MASNQHGQLSGSQIVCLGKEISIHAMEAFAEGYLEISDATIKNLREQNKNDMEAVNRQLIKNWVNRNSGPNQVKVKKSRDAVYCCDSECLGSLVV